MYYSAATRTFYPAGLRATYEANGTWPGDAVKVTTEEWKAYGQSPPPAGKQRGADANGRPAWVDLPAASLEDLAATAMRRINTGYTEAMHAILAEYPDAETLSFDKQEKQAETWNAWQQAGAVPDNQPTTPYLDAMLLERPIGKAELVARILTKAEQFTAAHGQATGRRQRLEDEVKAAQATGDRAALEALTW